MKLLLLTLCFVYAQCRPDIDRSDDNYFLTKGRWNGQMKWAMKRKFGESYAASPEDACSQACEKPLPSGYWEHLVREPKLEKMKEFYNKDLLTKSCQNANETLTCVKTCPDTQRHAFLREVFAPIKYLCADSRKIALLITNFSNIIPFQMRL